MTALSARDEPDYVFAPEERPALPGGPATPRHPARRRACYALIALLAGVASTFGNGLVTVNVNNIAGSLGLDTTQANFLPAIYVAFNATANLTLVKGRAQFGVQAIMRTLLSAYALAALLQFLVSDFATAALIRAVCGMTAASLVTYSIYNWMQVLPAASRPLALVLGIGLSQLGVPLARLVPLELLAADNWRTLHLIELAIATSVLAASTLLPLPQGDRTKAFERLDLVTIGLLVPAMLCLTCVLGEGRLLWWTDTAWLGWSLTASVILVCAALLVEHGRAKPLLQLRWLGTMGIIRFAGVALLVRLALAEQTYGAVGLLTSGGLTNDQLHILFALVTLAMVLGTVVAGLTMSPERLLYQVTIASLIIATGAWMDSDATNVTRPEQLYVSQVLIAFGTTLFVGPSLLYGFLQMFQRGADHFVTFIVLFSASQNVGGLAGSALLGSYQVIRSHAHAGAISEHLLASDPLVAQRIQGGTASLAGALVDPGLRAAQGAGLLGQAMTREANILAFNDVFRLVAILALLTAAYVGYRIAVLAVRRHQSLLAQAAS